MTLVDGFSNTGWRHANPVFTGFYFFWYADAHDLLRQPGLRTDIMHMTLPCQGALKHREIPVDLRILYGSGALLPSGQMSTTLQSARALLSADTRTLNMAYAAIDRHVDADKGQRVALRHLSKSGDQQAYSYAELQQLSARFAGALAASGLDVGGRVFTLLGRVPELYVAALGTVRYGAVFTPLFAAFGPDPIRTRMEIGGANILVTTRALYQKKVASWRRELPTLELIIVVDGNADEAPADTLHFSTFLSRGAIDFPVAVTQPEDLALIHFTSGTTGKPKGVMHVHEAVVGHYMSAQVALDMQAGDIYWCTADPGWVTGTSYGIFAPLAHGVTMVVDEAEFDPRRWYDILARERVNVWYTAPTAIRMLMKAGTELAREHLFPALRFMASVGEPLNPAAVEWGEEAFGMPFHDNWWQTETGCIMIANWPGMVVKPGAMGKPLPGVEAAVADADGALQLINESEKVGELVLKQGWPSMMRGYIGEMARYEKCFVDGWYKTGDLVRRDEDGYYWFVSRADDVIQSAGHLISPFEVESVLVAHAAVAEAAVIGLPDETVGEVVSAYVSLHEGYVAEEALRRQILGHARAQLGPSVAPRTITFSDNLPHTRSGKIMRRLLKARELGLDEGDTSSLAKEDEHHEP
jgi:acetyl-CoA synthetase